MALPYPSKTFTNGQVPTTAQWNELNANDQALSAGTGFATTASIPANLVSNPYKFSAYRNAAWTAASGTFGLVTFDAELFDTSNNYNTANGRFTAPIAGFYQFNAAVFSGVTSGVLSQIAIYKNGAVIQYGGAMYSASSNTQSVTASFLVQLAASDYVEIYYFGSGGAGSTGAGATAFSGFFVSK